MDFQQTHILWFLFLLLIPLIIHLVNFQRTRVLAFPGVYRLIQQIQVSQQQRKLQNWLIWICRTVALTCIILAFALPTCNDKFGNKNDFDRYVLVIDNSLSASVRNDDGMSFEKMRSEIQQFLKELPQDHLVCLITQSTDDNTGWLTAQEVSTIVDTITCSIQYSGWLQWKSRVEKAIKLGESNFNLIRSRTKVLVFTDLEQSSAVGILNNGINPRQMDKSSIDRDTNSARKNSIAENAEEWQLVRYPLVKVNNVSIDTAFTTGAEDSSSVPSVKVRLKNYSSQVSSVSLTLKSSGKVLGNKKVEIEAEGSSLVELPINLKDATVNRNSQKIKVEGQGLVVEKVEDAYPWDDKLFIHTVPAWKLKVGIIGRNMQLERMFAVQSSLAVSAVTRPIVPKQLAEYQSLVLIGLDGLNTSEMMALKDFMDAGGVIFQCFNDVPVEGNVTVTTPFGLLKGKNKSEKFLLDKSGFANPVFRNAFNDLPDDGTSTPEFTYNLQLSNLTDYNSVLIGENGSAMLVQKKWGTGSYWLWVNALNKGSEAWMRSPWSLPVFTEIISSNNKNDNPLFGQVNSSAVVKIPGLKPSKERSVSITYLGTEGNSISTQKNAKSWIKEWQQDILGNGGVYWGTEPDYSGFYSIVSSDEGRLLAMNIGRNESALREIEDVDFISEKLGIINFQQVETGMLRQATDKSNSQKTWKYFLWFSVFFLVLEIVLQAFKNKSVKQG